MAVLTFGSVCSGIEAASLAFGPHGWSAAWFSEIEPFPSAVLAHHYPTVPNLGDMTALPERVRAGEVKAPDMLCGGTPCQAFSVAGNRESLADARGNLTLTFCELADAIDDVRIARGDEPCDVFWENVPGVLSTADNAFGCFLGALVGAGAALVPGRNQRWTDAGVVAGPRRVAAWRVLDAQHFGLAQRRRRVFVVAGARAGFDPAAVLLERQGVPGHPAARRRAGQDAAAGPACRVDGSGRGVTEFLPQSSRVYMPEGLAPAVQASGHRNGNHAPQVLAYGGNNTSGPIDVATACNAHGGSGRMDFESETFIAFDPTQITSATNRSNPQPGDPCHTLAKGQHAPAIAYAPDVAGTLGRSSRGGGQTNSPGHNADQQLVAALGFNARQDPDSWVERPGPLDTDAYTQAVQQRAGVRRLTPRECERLQGFPDNFTAIPWRGRPAEECPDGPRYKAIGNSWAVDCVAWIAERLTAHRRISDVEVA